MNEKFLQVIQKMGIYELRTLAREMGVTSPTTLKRQQLIDSILEIANGDKQGNKGLTRGRKPKKTEDIAQLLSKYVPDSIHNVDINSQLNQYEIPNYFKVSAPSRTYISNLTPYNGAVYEKQGTVELKADGTGVILTDNAQVVVPQKFIQNFAIENGQNIKVYCGKVEDKENSFIAIDIDTDCIFKKIDFKNLDSITKTKKLNIQPTLQPLTQYFKHNSIYAGQSVFVTYTQEVNAETVITEISNSIKDIKGKKIALLSNQLEFAHLKQCYDNFSTMSMLDSALQRARNISATFETAKSYVEQGIDCVLVVGNISTIFATLKQVFITSGQSDYVATETATQYMASMFVSARQTNKGSLTIIAITQENEPINNNNICYFNAFINFIKNEKKELALKNSFSIYE